jgi:hypothetical protein
MAKLNNGEKRKENGFIIKIIKANTNKKKTKKKKTKQKQKQKQNKTNQKE